MTGDASGARGDGRIANVAGAVLVGGASRRFGRDKARAEVGGIAMATRLARLLDDLFEEVVLVGGDPPDDAPGRRVPDPEAPGDARSALRGIVGALEAARAERVVVLATDLPRMRVELVLALAAWPPCDAVVVRDALGRPEPLCGAWARDAVLPAARELLARGEYRLTALLGAIDAHYLEGADLAAVDPDGVALANVNTAGDLAALEARGVAPRRSDG
ncbi:MAG: molybdenum cofactor guanylyltransferase [Myxococcota bacterium]|nr:molybdenum cofactor guanylyltransferase [Myxococcales bacterium]